MCKMTFTMVAAVMSATSTAIPAHADVLPYWPYEKLLEQSDLVMIGTPTQTTKGEQSDRVADPIGKVISPVVTEFKVQVVLKGKADRSVSVLHFEWKKGELIAIDRRADFVEFATTVSPGVTTKEDEYLLFLRKKRDGAFEFVTGIWQPKLAIRLIRCAESAPAVGTCGTTEPVDKTEQVKMALFIMSKITKIDDGKQEIIVFGGSIEVHTTAIDEIVRMGTSALQPLIVAMDNEQIDFDTFARCYAACNQILRSKKVGREVYWSGGCKVEKTARGNGRIAPDGQKNLREFRKRVTEDIKALVKAIE